MSRPKTRLVAVMLTLCLLALSGFLYPQTVGHAAHHESHHGSMAHGTALCTWMCAAGQGIETFNVSLATHLQPLAFVALSPPVLPDVPAISSTASRAPPTFSS